MDIEEVKSYLKNYSGKKLTLMEVCGTHTASISENGIPSLLSEKIHLVSGPGCPVCVTVTDYIDRLCELSKEADTCVVTFGDMIRVPGSKGSLANAKAAGGNVKMVYSPLDTMRLAKENPAVNFVFAAVGFETTTPVYAVLMDEIIKKDIKNIRLLTALKTMPPVIEKLCNERNAVDGFIAPGHVAVITGEKPFAQLAEKYRLPFVISGFEGEELLCTIYALAHLQGKGICKNLYKRAVSPDGNRQAEELVEKYFEPCNAAWRGLGEIENSGMALKSEFGVYDAGSRNLLKDAASDNGCRCAEVIAGLKKPGQCPLFGKGCTPENPQGACMVSSEGSCHNYFINNRND